MDNTYNCKLTDRGFERIPFADADGQMCSLQVCSAIDPRVWFGVETNREGEAVFNRALLDKDMCRQLIKHLQLFIDKDTIDLDNRFR